MHSELTASTETNYWNISNKRERVSFSKAVVLNRIVCSHGKWKVAGGPWSHKWKSLNENEKCELLLMSAMKMMITLLF